MNMRGIAAAALGLAVIVLPASAIPASGDDPRLVSLGSVIATIARARTVTASAYVLSPRSRMGRALMGAARRGATVSIVLDGEGLAGATRSNRESALAFAAAAGVRVRVTDYQLHMKAVIVDGTNVFVSDRNWTASRDSLILALPASTRLQVERAILGQPTSNGTFATRKRDALALEANLLAQRRSHVVLVETESFSTSAVSTILGQRARAGDDVTLVVAASEYRTSPRERAELADLAHAGVHVFTASSDEKIAVDGSAGWTGSTNQTPGWGNQVDWGLEFGNAELVAALAQHVRDDAAHGTALH